MFTTRCHIFLILTATALSASVSAQAAGDEPSVMPPAAATSRPTGASGASVPSKISFGDQGMSGEDASELMMFKDIPVVVAAGKREQTEHQAPASVTIITADEIEKSNYESLADALRNQRSFFLHTDGLNWFLGERGFERPGEWNARILVTVDGRPTNDLIYGQTHLDRDFVAPVEVMKQVEVVRGPGSSLYGTNAVFGVINVVTKDGADVNGLQVKAEGGTLETGRISAVYGQVLPGGWDVIGAVTGYSSRGANDIIYNGVNDAAHNFGHIEGADYEGVYSLFLKVKKGDLTASFDYESREKGNRSATYDVSFFDPGTMHENRGNVTLKYDHEVTAGQSIHAMVYWSHYGYDQNWLYAPMPPTPGLYYTSFGVDEWVGEEVYYDWQITKKLRILAGSNARQSIFTHQHDFDSMNPNVLNIPASTNNWGLFVEAEYKLADPLTLTLGGRVDDTQRTGYTFSPRAAVILTPDKPDTIKLLYGRAFRQPNLYEQLYSSGPGGNTPNPFLKPEIADTYEAVWERELNDGWRTSVNGFLWQMKDAMEDYTYPDGSLQTRNGDNIWAHGVEAEIGRKWENGASVRAYGTYTRAERSGMRVPDSPEWILGLAIVWPIYKNNTFISVQPQFVGDMKNDLGQYIQATYITNIVLTSRDILPNTDFQAGVYNLFADRARLPRDGPFNQIQTTLDYPPMSFLFSLTYHFH